MIQKIKKWTEDFQFNQIPTDRIQVCCLIFVCAMVTFGIIFGEKAYGQSNITIVSYMNLAGLLFFCTAVRKPVLQDAKKILFAGMLLLAWTILLQIMDFRHFSQTAYYGMRFPVSAFLCEYLMIFPFAFLRDEKEKLTGIRVMGWMYTVGCLILILLFGCFMLGMTPELFANTIRWSDYRISINWNANILARIFMLGIGFSIIYMVSTPKIWMKILTGFVLAAELIVFAFANSRVAIVILGIFLAGIVFCWIYSKNVEKFSWKFMITGLAASIIVILLIILLLNLFFFKYIQAHADDVSNSVNYLTEFLDRRTSKKNWISFGSRTPIWEGTWEAICAHPSVLLTGVQDVGAFISEYLVHPKGNAHNSWLQVLLKLGLPGFLFALWLTWQAIRNGISLLFLRKSSMQQKIVCLMVLSMLGTELLEPFIFYGEYPTGFYNMAFLMCLGYMIYWKPRTEKIVWKTK